MLSQSLFTLASCTVQTPHQPLPQPVYINDNTYTLDRYRLDVMLPLDIGGYLLRSFSTGKVIDRNIAALCCELLSDESS
jgi:hypothetical protein